MFECMITVKKSVPRLLQPLMADGMLVNNYLVNIPLSLNGGQLFVVSCCAFQLFPFLILVGELSINIILILFFQGFFTRNRCPRGKNCNFLHVYRNPGNAFRSMDRDGSSPGQPPYTERGSERSMRDWRRDSRDRESSIRERSSDRDYERNREYRYSRERERYRDRDHERRHYRESHECRSSKRRDRDNGHDSDEEHSRRHNENHKDSPQRSRQDRFGRDVDRSISKRQETNGNNSNKRNSSDKDNDDVVLHQEHHKRKISHNDRDLSPDGSNGGSHSDHSHSDQEDGKR